MAGMMTGLTFRVLRLPIPQVLAHGLEILLGLPSEFLLRQLGIRRQIRYVPVPT